MAYTDKQIEDLEVKVTKAADKIESLEKENKALKARIPQSVAMGGAPWVTTGPVGQDSRGFRVGKAIGVQLRLVEPENAKEEIEACRQFAKALKAANWLPEKFSSQSLMIPLSSDLLSDDVTSQTEYKAFKEKWAAGGEGVDPDEVRWMAKAFPTVRKTAMSYLTDTIGGTLVPPPVQGELIELVRPREALQSAGVTRVPLPPNGRIVYPRQTGPTTMYWVGENTPITESNPTTGQIALQAKKGAVLTRVPNELLLYASVAADALIRTDMSKTIALGMDYAGLYGSGSAPQPKGLTLYTGTNEVIQYAGVTPAPKGVATNGNTLRPEDGYRMIGLLEDRNFEFKGWIFRPTMANNVMGYRADAAAPVDAAGGFVQSFMRAVSDRLPGDTWVGYPVTKSATVKNTLTKGSGTGLTEVFGGQWEHLLHGLYGAVELLSSNITENALIQDQTLIRALVHTDFVPRYEGAFVWYTSLLNQTN